MVAIKDFEMPKNCKECPLTYLDMGDDAYFGANESRCVIDGSCIDGMGSERAYDCPLVEAISKADYENRLKADLVAMLSDIQLEIEEQSLTHSEDNILSEWGLGYNHAIERCGEIIQEKINALKKEDT